MNTSQATQAGPPGRYHVTIRHHRRDPIEHRVTYPVRIWLVDLDDLPRLPRPLGALCRFDARDHFDNQPAAIRDKLDAWLAAQGAPRPARVLMLAQPRQLGYVFNPLSVFYCLDSNDQLQRTVAEVRNTYGGRHCYLLTPDVAGRSRVDKVFHVSPFHPDDGVYQIRTPLPGPRLAVGITLHRPGAAPFTATMTGRRRGEPSLWPALAHPLATRAVTARIRRHGITLYLKGLRPQPRPTKPTS